MRMYASDTGRSRDPGLETLLAFVDRIEESRNVEIARSPGGR